MENVIRIEIAEDSYASDFSLANEKLNAFDKSILTLKENLKGLNNTSNKIVLEITDKASMAIAFIKQCLDKFTSKTWPIKISLIDNIAWLLDLFDGKMRLFPELIEPVEISADWDSTYWNEFKETLGNLKECKITLLFIVDHGDISIQGKLAGVTFWDSFKKEIGLLDLRKVIEGIENDVLLLSIQFDDKEMQTNKSNDSNENQEPFYYAEHLNVAANDVFLIANNVSGLNGDSSPGWGDGISILSDILGILGFFKGTKWGEVAFKKIGSGILKVGSSILGTLGLLKIGGAAGTAGASGAATGTTTVTGAGILSMIAPYVLPLVGATAVNIPAFFAVKSGIENIIESSEYDGKQAHEKKAIGKYKIMSVIEGMFIDGLMGPKGIIFGGGYGGIRALLFGEAKGKEISDRTYEPVIGEHKGFPIRDYGTTTDESSENSYEKQTPTTGDGVVNIDEILNITKEFDVLFEDMDFESLTIIWSKAKEAILEDWNILPEDLKNNVFDLITEYSDATADEIKEKFSDAKRDIQASWGFMGAWFLLFVWAPIQSAISKISMLVDELIEKLSKLFSLFSLPKVGGGANPPNTAILPTTELANGGILTSPQIALVGEAGPESVIPLSQARRDRGIALWQETGEILGVLPTSTQTSLSATSESLYSNHTSTGSTAHGTLGDAKLFEREIHMNNVIPFPAVPSRNETAQSFWSAEENSATTTDSLTDISLSPYSSTSQTNQESQSQSGVNVQVNITSSPDFVIQATDGAEPEDVLSLIKSHSRELARELADDIGGELAERLGMIYDNVPLKGVS